MALAWNNYDEMRGFLYRLGFGKEEMQAEDPPLSKSELMDAFQAIDDWFEGERSTIKSDVDTAVGRTLAAALVKKIGKAWLRWKWGLE